MQVAPLQERAGRSPRARWRGLPWGTLLTGVALSGFVFANVEAQLAPKPTGRPGGGKTTSPAGKVPVTGKAPVAGKPAAGKVGPADKTTAKPVPIDAEGEDYSGPTLPRDFSAPRKPLPMMEQVTELMSPEEDAKINAELIKEKFPTLLRGGELTNEKVKETLRKGAKHSVYKMTERRYLEVKDKEKDKDKKIPTIVDIRDKLVRETNAAGSVGERNGIDAAAVRRFREFYMREIVARASELLELNFQVRLNAVILLSELTIQEAKTPQQVDEPFVEAADPLLKVVNDPTQPVAVKIHAVKGLSRICADGKPTSELKLKIGQSLAKELKRKDTHFWYQMRLAEGLGNVDLVVDSELKPYAAQILTEVLVDNERHCVARAEAARSLGRIPLDGNVNVPLIAFETAMLAQHFADEYNKDPKGVYWKDCFLKTYLAFRPKNAAGKDRGDGLMTKTEKGTMAKHRSYVQEAYDLVVPVVSHVIDPKTEGTALPAAVTDPLADWIKKKQPADNRVSPNLEPLAILVKRAAP